MLLQNGGADIFYIDESHDAKFYVVTAVTVPFLRNTAEGWKFVWDEHRQQSLAWRQGINSRHQIPLSKELHGVKLAKRRGNYKFGKRQLTEEECFRAYADALSTINFLPNASIITVTGTNAREMYGKKRILRVMHALFQRMRMQCRNRSVNAMAFFDEGHPEYREMYRKAQKYLPTGDRQGNTVNRPLEMFLKDGNFKQSAFCRFTQIADLVAYAALQKIRAEHGDEKSDGPEKDLFNHIPKDTLNLSISRDGDGILRLG